MQHGFSVNSFIDFLTGALSAPPRTFLPFSNAELDRVKVDVEVGVEVEVGVRVEVEVGVEVEVNVRAQNFFFLLVGWVAGEMENKAIFQLEVEVGAWQ